METIAKIPRKIEVTFPVWGIKEHMLLSVDDILGTFAMWAVKQSPYAAPENLMECISDLKHWVEQDFDFSDMGFTKKTIEELRAYLEEVFEKIDSTAKLNVPKKDSGSIMQGSSSRYHTTKPDYDFIDLGALARNISHTCGMEYFYWK